MCLLRCFSFYVSIESVEELGIKEFLPAYLDPSLQPSELPTGVNFASGGAGYDPLTSKLAVPPVATIVLFFITEYKQKWFDNS